MNNIRYLIKSSNPYYLAIVARLLPSSDLFWEVLYIVVVECCSIQNWKSYFRKMYLLLKSTIFVQIIKIITVALECVCKKKVLSSVMEKLLSVSRAQGLE